MVMKLWIVGTLLFALGMLIDGTARRKIKASAAGYVSPLLFHLAGHGLLLLTETFFAVLVVPVPVLTSYWIVVAASLGCLLWKAAESFQSQGNPCSVIVIPERYVRNEGFLQRMDYHDNP